MAYWSIVSIKIGNIIFDQDRDDVPLKLKTTQCILIVAKAKTSNVVNTNGSQHVTKIKFVHTLSLFQNKQGRL